MFLVCFVFFEKKVARFLYVLLVPLFGGSLYSSIRIPAFLLTKQVELEPGLQSRLVNEARKAYLSVCKFVTCKIISLCVYMYVRAYARVHVHVCHSNELWAPPFVSNIMLIRQDQASSKFPWAKLELKFPQLYLSLSWNQFRSQPSSRLQKLSFFDPRKEIVVYIPLIYFQMDDWSV